MLAFRAIFIAELISSYFIPSAFAAAISNAASIAPVLESRSTAQTEPASGDYIISQSPISGKTVYSTFSAAIAAIDKVSSSKTVTVFVYPGTYKEQLTFNRSGTTIFRGYTEDTSSYTHNQVTIQNSHGVDTQSGESDVDSATLYSRATDIQLYNINLKNTFGQTRNYASLGFAIDGNGLAAFYGCQITGNQDTFYVNAGSSVFAYNTLVEGSIDFIWGSGSAYFLNSTIVPNTKGGYISAMKRASASTTGGLVFDQSYIIASSSVSSGSVYLGRPWNQYAKVAYIKSYLDASIASAGWSVWSTSDTRTSGVVFGEYQNYGSGAATTGRASFSTQLSSTSVAQFQLSKFFSSTSWIDMTSVKTTPFSV
ncbi:carbohydrate esterase family 8 protein [Daldinia vernicosa]|uniref:carbohydrate esterase family 8 protein n=1 Tax=Daldinia vernicosa TaxID=114800 RepID=UPI002007E8DE|nr:carbohydrate esterase family 8 protein [Daldinia vernicosa]KAI0849837.1 carbohydrate esterase family 8 protein [Daldinia vernicosa]